MYLKKTYIAGETIEVQKTYSKRYGRKIERGQNFKPTPQAVKNYNEKIALRELTRKLNANFHPRDIHLTLTYRKEDRPPPEQAKKDLEKFIRKTRAYFRKQGRELKYISVTEYKRKAIHHHIIINTMDARDIADLWPHGGMHPEFLYPNGEYSALAYYLIKETKNTFNEPDGACGKRWRQSKNLIKPEPEIEVVDAKTWRKPPTPIKGYTILVDSIDSGKSAVTGIPYLFYRMVPIPSTAKVRLPNGTMATGERAALLITKQNREDIKNAWKKQHDDGGIQADAGWSGTS